MNITLGILIKKIAKNWLIIAIVTVLMSVGGLVYSKVFTPKVYVATATSNINYSADNTPIFEGDFSRLMLLLETEAFKKYLALYMDELGSDGISLSTTHIAIDIEILTFNVKDLVTTVEYVSIYDNPEDAFLIVTHFTRALQLYLEEVPVYDTVKYTVSNINVAAKNTVNTNDRSIELTVFGLAAGLLLSSFCIIAYTAFNRRLNTVYSFDQEFDIEVLGTVYYDIDENIDDHEDKLNNKPKENSPEDN